MCVVALCGLARSPLPILPTRRLSRHPPCHIGHRTDGGFWRDLVSVGCRHKSTRVYSFPRASNVGVGKSRGCRASMRPPTRLSGIAPSRLRVNSREGSRVLPAARTTNSVHTEQRGAAAANSSSPPRETTSAKEFYNLTPSHNTGHGTGAHWRLTQEPGSCAVRVAPHQHSRRPSCRRSPRSEISPEEPCSEL